LKENEKLEVVDFKSANNYTVALMSDGNLYGWGSNESGQMGIKTEIGIVILQKGLKCMKLLILPLLWLMS
jgi:alpha-tubulin suppressor-like RCC1 family protein